MQRLWTQQRLIIQFVCAILHVASTQGRNPVSVAAACRQLLRISAGAARAGEGVEADLMTGPYAHTAADAAAAIGLSLLPLEQEPHACGGGRVQLAPVWEGEQVAESPYQRFIQVGALPCPAPPGPPLCCMPRR